LHCINGVDWVLVTNAIYKAEKNEKRKTI
jgi:hypothetical protein